MSRDQAGILFVCLGNICRSPLAEGIFLHLAAERGTADRFDVDSCGTGAWHVGDRPDPRSIQVAEINGVSLPGHARKFDPKRDIKRFDYIIAMDRSNRDTLIERGAPAAQVSLMLGYGDSGDILDVPDPYYSGDSGFQTVYDLLLDACGGLLDSLSE